MAEPWKDYAAAPAAASSGPWSQYAARPVADNQATGVAKKPQPSGVIRRVVGDTAVDVGRGIIGVGEAAVGVADMVTGGHAGKALESIGYKPQETKDIIGEYYSPERKEANQKVADAKGFVDTARTMLENPSTIAGAVAESAPLMAGGGAVARGLGAVGRFAARPIARAAIGEGVVGAGSAAEQTRQQTDDGLLTGKQIAAAAGSGVGTAVIGAAGGRVAQKLGIGDVDVALAGGNTAAAGSKGVVRRAAEGALAEGVLEEMPQSMQEQAWQNVAQDKPLGEGVAEAGAQGLLTGGAMGAPVAAFQRPGEQDAPRSSDIPINNDGLAQPPRAARPAPKFDDVQGAVKSTEPAGPITQAAADEPVAVEVPEARPFPNATPGSLADAGNVLPRTAARPQPTQNAGMFERIATERAAEQQKREQAVQAGAVDPATGEISPAAASPALSPKQKLAAEFQAATGDLPEQAVVRRAGIAMRNLQRENGALEGDPEPDPYTPEQDVLLKQYQAAKNPSSRYLFHTTTPDRLASIVANGLQPGSKPRHEGVGGEGRVSLATNEATASYFGAKGDTMLRLRKDYDPGDLQADLLGGENSLTTGQAIPPDALEIKQGKKWIPLSELRGAQPAPAPGARKDEQARPRAQPVVAEEVSDAELDAYKNRNLTPPAVEGDKWDTAKVLRNSRIGHVATQLVRESAKYPDGGRRWTKQADGRWSDGESTLDTNALARMLDRGEDDVLEGAATRVVKQAALAAPQPVGGVAAAAAEAATSPSNDLPEPTAAQKEAGNFKVGRTRINGLDISIEHPAGVKRKAEHSQALAHAYGYIRRTEGADGEKVDVFLGDRADDTNLPVFVVDQHKADGSFDEHKALMGFQSEAEARAAYSANYPKDWKGLRGIRQFSHDEFKAWVRDSEATKAPATAASPGTDRYVPPPTAKGKRASFAREFVVPNGYESERPWVQNQRTPEYGIERRRGKDGSLTVSARVNYFQSATDGNEYSAYPSIVIRKQGAQYGLSALRHGYDGEDALPHGPFASEEHATQAATALIRGSAFMAPFDKRARHVYPATLPAHLNYDGQKAAGNRGLIDAQQEANREALAQLKLKKGEQVTISNGGKTTIGQFVEVLDAQQGNVVVAVTGARGTTRVTIGASRLQRPTPAGDAQVQRYRDFAAKKAGNADYFNADLAKELSPAYSASKEARRENNEAVATEASALAFKAFEARLKDPAPAGEVVTLMAGGTSSGKSTMKPAAGIVYDSTMYDPEKAARNIDMVLASGRAVRYRFVFREPVDAFRDSILRGQESGRFVNLTAFARTHEGAYRALQELQRKYQGDGRVKFELYDNTARAARAVDSLPQQDYNGLKENLHDILDAEREAGRLSEAEYRAIEGSARRADLAGRPDQGSAEGRRGKAVPHTGDTRRGPAADASRGPEQSEGLVSPDTPPTGGVSASGAADPFAGNTIFTSDKVASAMAVLKSKLGQLNSGIDPEMFAAGATVAGAYIESGVRKFGAYAKAMVEALGDSIKPYLLSFYEGARYYPGLDAKGMDSAADAQREFEALLTPADLQTEAIGNAKPPRKTRAKATTDRGARTLRDDWGVDGIDGWTPMPGVAPERSDYGLLNGVKAAFLKDATAYLKAVAEVLEDQGYTVTLDRKGKPAKAVSVDESGVAGSGEVSLHMVAPSGTGIYAHISDTSLRGVVPTTTSGVALMYRTTDGTHGKSGANQWGRVDLTAAELAAELAAHVDRNSWKPEANKGSLPVRVVANAIGRDGLSAAERDAGKKPYSTLSEAQMKRLEQLRDALPTDAGAEIDGARADIDKAIRMSTAGEPGAGIIDVLDRAYLRVERKFSAQAEVIGEIQDEIAVDADQAHNGPKEAADAPVQPNRDPAESERVPRTAGGEDRGDAAAGDGDRQPLDAGVAGAGEGAGGQPSLFDGADGAGGARAARPERGAERDAPGAARGDGGVRSGSGASGAVEDFDLTGESLGKGGLTTKYRDNVAVIRIIKALEAENRVATPDERKQLARYVGWGALKGVFDPQNKQWAKQHAELKELLTPEEFAAARASTRNAHFTSQEVVAPMIEGLQRLGFTRGRLLEPSVGTGNFFGMMPARLRGAAELFGVELDPLTAKIAAGLYPSARITNSGFEAYQVPGGFFDAAIGNPPFGEEPIADSDRSPYSGFSIHNYFLAKTIDKLRPGGVAMMVVSHNFMDARDARVRQWIADRASLVAAVRLPDTAFKGNAGTEVVTDILVFQKHDQNGLPSDSRAWVNAGKQTVENPKTGESAEHNVNQYFLNNPEDVLGTATAGGTMYGPNQYTVKPNGDLQEQLAKWVQRLPQGQYQPIDRTEKMQAAEVPEGIKVGSYYVDAKGQVQQRGEDAAGAKTARPWMPPNTKADARMRGMIEVRDVLRGQMRMERDPLALERAIEGQRARLNVVYDAFVKEHGYLNSPVNRRIFIEDSDSDLVQALEFDYDNGISKAVAEKEGIEPRAASARKADIFERRVAFPQNDMQTVHSAKDALIATLNYRGRVDTAYMAKVYDKDADAIVAELGDLVYTTPQGVVETADAYLSGDVKTKLAEAEAAAKDDPAFARNVKALKGVIPADKTPSEIHVSLGAHFVPGPVLADFMAHITGAEHQANYVKSLGRWMLSKTGNIDQVRNQQTWGTPHVGADAIIRQTIDGRSIVVTRTERDGDRQITIVMEAETEAAREKQNAIRNEWRSWLWSDPERAEKVLAEYNDKMNRTVRRRYDGSHLSLPGKNPAITLLKHQLDGVWRGLQSRQILLDHVVGAGKTYQIVAMVMEMRRLGIARKPVLAVPNHLTLQWRSEFTRLYPGSRVLAATPEDFSKENRPKLFSKIVTGDWDAVILGHSSLKKIGLPPEMEADILKEQIEELASAIEETKRERGDRNIIRDMEGIRKNLEAKMKERLNAAGERDKVLTFDELGLDALGVDELHEFKNLTYSSTMTKVPGMGNPKGSARAFDLFVKTQWLFRTYGEQAPLITATGTPVSNSLVEMYNVQRYMQYPRMKRDGLHMFDAWARAYGSVENVYEVAPSGSGFRASSRFAKFQNLSSLMADYMAFADVVTLDDLKAQEEARGRRFPAPKVKGGKPQLVVAPRSPLVAEFMGIPKLARWPDDGAKFKLDLAHGDTFETEAKDGKTFLRMKKADGGAPIHLGTYENLEEAQAAAVEAALSPEIELDPGSVLGRFARVRELTRETKGKVNALSLTGEANKAGLDYRLIDPAAPDFPDSKINRAVDNIVAEHKAWKKDKGTQLVFCDMSVPLSARAALADKPKRAYVRDTDGAVIHKRATLHAAAGAEELPFLVVEARAKAKDRPAEFAVYDAATGHLMAAGQASRAAAKGWAEDALATADGRAGWIKDREGSGELQQEEIDEYNDANEIDTAEVEAITLQDIAGASGASGFSVYDDMRAKLVKKGIPEREIAFIHDYSTPSAKAKLFAAVNRGDVRVLFGSTPKMGAGTNVQERAVALHHIDAPWKPSDLEQREGRVIRRGNRLYERDPEGFEVGIYRYATAQTYDARRWQILEHKARGIEQLRKFDGSINEIDDIDGEASNAADMKAAASGDPLILRETQLRNDVKRLENLEAAHADNVVAARRASQREQADADKFLPRKLATIDKLIAARQPDVKDGVPAKSDIGGKKYGDRKEFTQALARAVGTFARETGLSRQPAEFTIQWRGLQFEVTSSVFGKIHVVSELGDVLTFMPAEVDTFSASGLVTRMNNAADRLDAQKVAVAAEIVEARENAKRYLEEAAKPFADAENLRTARREFKSVQRLLLLKGPDLQAADKKALEAGLEGQRAALRKAGLGEALDEMTATKGDAEGKYSRAAAPGRRLTMARAQQLKQTLTAKWGDDAPGVVLVESAEELQRAAGLPRSVLNDPDFYRSEGFYNGKPTVWLNLASLGDEKRFGQVLAHEALGHYSVERVVGRGEWRSISEAIARHVRNGTGDADLRAAIARVQETQPADVLGDAEAMAQEVIAVMAEQGSRNGLLGRVIAAVRRFLRKYMPALAWSDADVRDLLSQAESFLHRGRSRQERQAFVRAHAFSRAGDSTVASELEADTAFVAGLSDKERRSPAMQAFAHGMYAELGTESPFFRDWFGTSKVVDSNGKPLKVYHGTNAEFEAFDPARLGKSTNHMTAALGVFFDARKAKAEHYARVASNDVPAEQQVYEVFLSIQNPYRMSKDEFMAIDSIDKARATRARLEQDGHDGIQLYDIGQWIAFKPEQIKRTDNQGAFNAGDARMRFSRGRKSPLESVNEIQSAIREINAEVEGGAQVVQRIKRWLKDATPKVLKDRLRGGWLGLLTTRHLTDLGSDYDPTMTVYSEFLAKMGADRNALQQEGEQVAEGVRAWAGKNRAEAERLFTLMHDATIQGSDPAEAYKPLQFRYARKLYDVNRENVRQAIVAIREQMRGRAGDDKRPMMAEISNLRAMLKAEPIRRSRYPEMVARWSALSPEAKEHYRAMRDLYAARHDATEAALVARINDLKLEGGEKRKEVLVNMIRQQFEAQRLQGVYFPLQRFGRYFVAADKDDASTFLMFESLPELQRAVQGLRARGFKITAQGLKSESKAKDAPSGSFVAEVLDMLQKSGVKEETRDQVYQMYLQALPELSMRKHKIHRKVVPGWDSDALRAFAFNMHHGAHQLARLRYAHKLSDTIAVLQDKQDRARREEGADTARIVAFDAILEELRKRHEWIGNPQDSRATNLVSSFGFAYYLGLTPAAALVNLTQVPLLAYPFLASRFGGIAAMNELLRSMQGSGRTLGHIQRTLTDPAEIRAHKALQEAGALDKTQVHNLAGIAEGGLAGYNPKYAKAMEFVSKPFHLAEVVNREATGIAAFRLARAAGKGFDEAVKVAADAINETMFDYTNANRARFMQSGTAKVLLMFRQYSLNMTWHMGRMLWNATKGVDPEVKRIARRNLAGVLGMSALFSGTLGLPLVSVTMGVLNAVAASGGDDDEPWDAETEFRAFLIDMLGADLASIVLDGPVNRLSGADVASRVSLSQLWFRDADRELDGRGAYYNLLEQAAGPMGGVLKNALVGKQLMDEGHLQRGVETVLPKALKDAVKAARYATEGANNLRGDALVEDLNLGQVLLQLIGFTPAEVAARYDENRSLKRYEQHVLDRRARLMDAFAMAVRLQDERARADTLEAIRAFNGKWPELGITAKTLRSSLASRARYSAQAENGIMLNKKIAGRIREEVGAD